MVKGYQEDRSLVTPLHPRRQLWRGERTLEESGGLTHLDSLLCDLGQVPLPPQILVALSARASLPLDQYRDSSVC